MKKLLLTGLSLLIAGATLAKPSIWIHTDLTAATSYSISGGDAKAITDKNSDPDDHVALANYLMLANKFDTVAIVMGSTNRDTQKDVKKFFDDTFRKAYEKDYPCLQEKIGGYPTPQSIKAYESSLTAGSGFIQFSTSPDNKYDNYNNLLPTVKYLVDELKKTKYSSSNPLYVLVWGGMGEIAMATKHLIRNNETAALNRLFVVSHWTATFADTRQGDNKCYSGSANDIYNVANCNVNCSSCKYMRDEAAKSTAKFRWVECGNIGQHGIVTGYGKYFNGVNGSVYNNFKKSALGELFVKSKFVFGKPDGSDCATFYAVLGNYGVKLSNFNDNGQLTKSHEDSARNSFKNKAQDMLAELETIAEVAAGSCDGGGDGDGGGGSDRHAIPGTIQAEAYTAQKGIQTANTSDAGGGKYVGWIGSGDWFEFDVNVSSAGSYKAEFRVAALSSNIKFQLRKGSSSITSVDASATGGWQTWKTVTKTITLSAGNQTLRVHATGGGWNMNWLKFTKQESTDGGDDGGTSSDTYLMKHKPSDKQLRYRSTYNDFVLSSETGEWAQWEYIPVDSTWFYLQHVPTGKRIGSSDGQTIISMSGTTSGYDAQWKVLEEGTWDRLIHRSSGNRLHIRSNGSMFQLGPNNWTGDNTRWQLIQP